MTTWAELAFLTESFITVSLSFSFFHFLAGLLVSALLNSTTPFLRPPVGHNSLPRKHAYRKEIRWIPNKSKRDYYELLRTIAFCFILPSSGKTIPYVWLCIQFNFVASVFSHRACTRRKRVDDFVGVSNDNVQQYKIDGIQPLSVRSRNHSCRNRSAHGRQRETCTR